MSIVSQPFCVHRRVDSVLCTSKTITLSFVIFQPLEPRQEAHAAEAIASEATAARELTADAAVETSPTEPDLSTKIDAKSLLLFFTAFSKHDFRYAYVPKTVVSSNFSSDPLEGWEAGFALETLVIAKMMSENKCIGRDQVIVHVFSIMACPLVLKRSFALPPYADKDNNKSCHWLHFSSRQTYTKRSCCIHRGWSTARPQ